MFEIKLSNGNVALIDKEDYNLVKNYNWYEVIDCGISYAYTNIKINNKKTTLKMHRLIVNPKTKESIDHINGNGLDNRKVNLKICTDLINSWNKTHNYTPYYCKRNKGYRIRIGINNKEVHFGYISNKISCLNYLNRLNKVRKDYSNNLISIKDFNDLLNKIKKEINQEAIKEGRKPRKFNYRIYFKETIEGEFDDRPKS